MKVPASQRMSMMSQDEAIIAMGKLFGGGKRSEEDQLILSVLALMIACRFRVAEVRTLPLDGWVTEDKGKDERKGLKFFESRMGEKTLAVRWLTYKQEELAAMAIGLAKLLTKAAPTRAHAKHGTSPLVVEPVGPEGVAHFLRGTTACGKFFCKNSLDQLTHWGITKAMKSGVPDICLVSGWGAGIVSDLGGAMHIQDAARKLACKYRRDRNDDLYGTSEASQ
jgi:hypothetical protein